MDIKIIHLSITSIKDSSLYSLNHAASLFQWALKLVKWVNLQDPVWIMMNLGLPHGQQDTGQWRVDNGV